MLFNALKNNNIHNFQDIIQQTVSFDDSSVLPHLSRILAFLNSADYKGETLISISNIVKQTSPFVQQSRTNLNALPKEQLAITKKEHRDCQIRNFQLQGQKLEWSGISFPQHTKLLISKALIQIATEKKVKQIRFWGKILGQVRDYYVIQGVRDPDLSIQQLPPGQEKASQGINYYSYWVANNPGENWVQLPDLSPEHVKVARSIKRLFTGDLNYPIKTYPVFGGTEKHYLKAQLCRMTHALELAPKGIYKVHDENPKVIEYEEQVKLPEFSEMVTMQTWVHKNQLLLNLGRCSHYVNPTLPEQQIESLTAQLAEKDPECERLRSITQDKASQSIATSLGVQTLWTVRTQGDNQIFSKQQVQLVYGVIVLKNIYWPGWTTIGFKGGYCNIYVGRGVKAGQDGWSTFQNPDIQEDAQGTEQYREPNPAEEPKVVPEGQPHEEQQPNVDQ